VLSTGSWQSGRGSLREVSLEPTGRTQEDGPAGVEEMTFGFGKHAKRSLPSGAMDAIAGLPKHPLLQLVVGIEQVSELTQGKEISLDVLDP
jgi:hypothetical protein